MDINEAEARRILAAFTRLVGEHHVLPRGTVDPPAPLRSPADWALIHRVWDAFPGLRDPASPLAVNDNLLYAR